MFGFFRELGAENTMDVRQTQKRQLVMNRRRSLSKFATQKNPHRVRHLLGAVQPPQAVAPFFQVEHPIVPHFCDIRITRAVPTSSSLEFQLSIRLLDSNFPSCDCMLQQQGWTVGMCRTCPPPRRDVSSFAAVLSVRSSACILKPKCSISASSRVLCAS